jgi:hypothetical protein
MLLPLQVASQPCLLRLLLRRFFPHRWRRPWYPLPHLLAAVRFHPPLYQVTLSLFLVVANGVTFSSPIDLLFLIPSSNTSPLTIFLELVASHRRTFNLNLMCGNYVLWVMYLGKSKVMEPSTVLFPLSGNAKLPFPSMTLGGLFIGLKQRKLSFRFLVVALT